MAPSKWEHVWSPMGTDNDPDFDKNPKPNFSFGVEIEFAIATLPFKKEDPDPDGRTVYGVSEREDGRPTQSTKIRGYTMREADELEHTQLHIVDTLAKYNIEAISERSLLEVVDHVYDDPPTSWLVSHDGTIRTPPDNNGRYNYIKIELTSPAYWLHDKAIKEIEKVCLILKKHYRIYCGPGSGLHVHVGLGTKGFSLSHLQNLAAIVWTFEPQLYSLMPSHRRIDINCLPLREYSILSHQLRKENRRPRDALKPIFATTSINELLKLLASKISNRLGFNCRNLMEAYELEYPCTPPALSEMRHMGPVQDTKKTVEWRMWESTLDTKEIKAWIRLVTGLHCAADECREDKLREWLRWHGEDDWLGNGNDEYPIEAVLYALKCKFAATYFGLRGPGVEDGDGEAEKENWVLEELDC